MDQDLRRLAERALERGLLSREDLSDPESWVIGARYRVDRALGRGAAGTVLEVTDLQLGRRAALKLLEPKAASDRFAQEIQVLSRLQHENVATVFDAGVHEGRPFYVMELCEGGSLAEADLALDDWVRVLIRVCAACEASHAQGVIHRDLKPENVLLGDRPRVADFGVAKLLDGSGPARTLTGAWVGTPAYMAPEQVLGEAVSPATDVHALGVMLFERLTGQLPFEGSAFEVARQLADEARPDPRALAPEAPARLCAVARRAMARDPAARYPSAAALGSALEQALEPARVDWRGWGAIGFLGGVGVVGWLWLAPSAAFEGAAPEEEDAVEAVGELREVGAEGSEPAGQVWWEGLVVSEGPSPEALGVVEVALEQGGGLSVVDRWAEVACGWLLRSLEGGRLRDAVDEGLVGPLERLERASSAEEASEVRAWVAVIRGRYTEQSLRSLRAVTEAVVASARGSERWAPHACVLVWAVYLRELREVMGFDWIGTQIRAEVPAALEVLRRPQTPAGLCAKLEAAWEEAQ